MAAEPYGAALTTPKGMADLPMKELDPVAMTGWEGRNGARLVTNRHDNFGIFGGVFTLKWVNFWPIDNQERQP